MLKQGTQWYQKLTTLFDRIPLQLIEIQPNFWQFLPKPLNFDVSYENIILTKDDIEKDNQIFLNRPIDQQHWLRNGSDLWLTTLFTATSYLNKNYTILFKDFYQYAKMQTLRLIFSNTTLLLSDYAKEIAQAADFQEKLISLELSAWNEVSKHRSAFEVQQNPPPLQTRVLDHRTSHTAKIMTAESVSSSAIRSEGWLNFLFKMFIEMGQEFFLRNKKFSQPIFPLTSAKESKDIKSLQLNYCTSGVWYGGTYREGITCSTKNMQVIIFPKNSNSKIATLEDTYLKQGLHRIEFNGRPAVYFEGDKTNVFYVPEISENPLDQLNDQLLLLQALFHEGKKFYRCCKNFFSEDKKQSQFLAEKPVSTCITKETKIFWKKSLDDIEKQLIDINRSIGKKVDLRWINYILEDRKEEFNDLNQLSEVNLETMSAFNENLKALQAEVVEIMKDLDLTVNNQDKDFMRNTNNLNNLGCKSLVASALSPYKKPNVTPWFFPKCQSPKERELNSGLRMSQVINQVAKCFF